MNRTKRLQAIISMGAFALILLFVNILGNATFGSFSLFGSLDLTEEKRFTLTEPTEELLQNLDEIVYAQVLLEGDFPADFKRLQQATREMLNDFRNLSGLLEYEFEDIRQGEPEEVNQRIKEMAEAGIVPTRFLIRSIDGTEERYIYPYVLLYYKGRSVSVNLLEEQRDLSQEEVLNNSINLLEYKLANAIQKLQLDRKPVVAFTSGRGELSNLETQDLTRSLRPYYEVGRFNLDSNYQVPPQIDLLVVAKPTVPFSERDKFKLDQYVMNGGKVLWMIDKVNAELDSLRIDGSSFVPRDHPINLDDLLFKYGVRIQPNLVLDLQCTQIPLVVGMKGGRPDTQLFPWFYHPLITPDVDHPIVKGLDNFYLFFPSRLDTVRTKTPVEKTILFRSSPNSREQFLPVRLNFEILRYDPDPSKFTKPNIPLAVLLEGTFPSLYENRLTQEMQAGLQALNVQYKPVSDETKMIVIADGDVARSFVTDPEGRAAQPLGFNRYDNRVYANKDLVMNCIDYLLDSNGVIEARGKEIKLRLLNVVKAQDEKVKWQFLNLAIPFVFISVFGFGFNYWRRRRFNA
ncbi:MAG: gliding motility-associated ABC transporter substrate-binding protein GldG [Bacteroidota bacterium]